MDVSIEVFLRTKSYLGESHKTCDLERSPTGCRPSHSAGWCFVLAPCPPQLNGVDFKGSDTVAQQWFPTQSRFGAVHAGWQNFQTKP